MTPTIANDLSPTCTVRLVCCPACDDDHPDCATCDGTRAIEDPFDDSAVTLGTLADGRKTDQDPGVH